MSDDDPAGSDGLENPARRLLLGGLAATVGVAAVGPAGASASDASKPAARTDAALRRHIDTVVVIYAENRSFNNLFADFPGTGAAAVELPTRARYRRRTATAAVLTALPPIWGGLVPHAQIIGGNATTMIERRRHHAPAEPRRSRCATPDGNPLPQGVVTRDLVHRFYENQMQINGGRNDGFVAWGDTGGMVMGHYGDAANLRLWHIAQRVHPVRQLLHGRVRRLVPESPIPGLRRSRRSIRRRRSPAKQQIAVLEDDPHGMRASSCADDSPPVGDGRAAEVRERRRPSRPTATRSTRWRRRTSRLHPPAPGGDPAWPTRPTPTTLPPQTYDTIGDLLSAKGVELGLVRRRLAGGAGRRPATASPGRISSPTTSRSTISPVRAGHRRARRSTCATPASAACRLNSSSPRSMAARCRRWRFYKPQGNLNMHAGYADIDRRRRAHRRRDRAPEEEPAVAAHAGGRSPTTRTAAGGTTWRRRRATAGARARASRRSIVSPFAKKGCVDHTSTTRARSCASSRAASRASETAGPGRAGESDDKMPVIRRRGT